jgi:alpha-1,6-mannosyltransferase
MRGAAPSILKFSAAVADRDATGHDLLVRSGGIMLGTLLFAVLFYHLPNTLGHAREEIGGWAVVVGSLTAYYFGFKAVRSSPDIPRLRRTIVAFAAVFCLAAICIPPFFSTDVYCYGNIGWQQARYGCNPYVFSPSEVPGWKSDPLFFASWEDSPCAYGFLFSELSCAIAWVADGSRVLATVLFKLAGAGVFAGTAWLVWRGCKRLGRTDGECTLYLFLWNPLLLLHFVGDAHNDLLMGLCTAAGVLCALAGGWFAAMPLLLGGTLVKYGSLVLAPLLLIYLCKRYGKAKAAIGLTVGAVLCTAAAAPYLAGDWQHIALGRLAETLSEWRNYTLAAFLYFPYETASQAFPGLESLRPEVKVGIKLVLGIGFLAFYGRLLWIRLRGSYAGEKLLRDCVLVQFVLVCLVSSKFYPWYLGMFLPLAYWLPAGDRLRQAVLAVACAQVLQFTFLREAHGINSVVLLLAPLAYVWYAKPKQNVGVDRSAEETAVPIRRAA